MGTTIERWEAVPGYEGRYEVSDAGRVRSLNYRRSGKVRALSTPANPLGYPNVNLRDGAISTTFLVHRLVATCFVPNPDNKGDVNHIDGVKGNNHHSNLEWVTRKENLWHARNVLRHQPDVPVATLNLSTGESTVFATRADAAKSLGLDPRSLRKVLTGALRSTRGFAAFYIKES